MLTESLGHNELIMMNWKKCFLLFTLNYLKEWNKHILSLLYYLSGRIYSKDGSHSIPHAWCPDWIIWKLTVQRAGSLAIASFVRMGVNGLFILFQWLHGSDLRKYFGMKSSYRQVFNISCTFIVHIIIIGNQIVDHSDVVGASLVGAAPTTSSFST